MKRSEAFPSKYMSKDDVKIPVIATIADVRPEVLKSDNGDESKPVMYFSGDHKPMIINNANWMTVEDLYGDDSDAWAGHTVELYHEPNIMFGNKRVGGIRIRKPAAQQTASVNPPFANFAAATAYALEHSITAESFKAYLKLQGLTAFSASRDSELAYRFVETEITGREAEPIE